MHRKNACILTSKPGRKQGFKDHFAFILVHVSSCQSASPSSLLALGNVPSGELSSCSTPQLRPKKARAPAVLQQRRLRDPPGTGCLMLITVCPQPPPYQNISVSSSCTLCWTELFLTLEEGIHSGATGIYCGWLRRSSSQERKDMSGMQGGKGQIRGARSALWLHSNPLRLSLPKHLEIFSADWL